MINDRDNAGSDNEGFAVAWQCSEMTDQVCAQLTILADPEAEIPAIELARQQQLLTLARPHGVENILWRKFSGSIDAAEGTTTLHRLGQAMLLERLRREIADAFEAKNITACVVKGPVFARKLYKMNSDRLFSDIDWLVDMACMERAISVMEQLGYQRENKFWDNSQRDTEYKFQHPSHPGALIELHGNLVHYPLLRKRAGFDLHALRLAGAGDTEAPSALLATAIVHATLGHKLDRLVMLVDVLQAARHLPPEAYDRTVTTLRQMQLGLESAVALSVVSRMFNDSCAAELAAAFYPGLTARLGMFFITPEAVVNAQRSGFQKRSWARRKAFRILQRLVRA